MKDVQKPEKVHLGKLIKEIGKGYFAIPDFQREFDWEPWDVRDLIKSIFLDYYIGTLLLWEGSKENYEVLSCSALYGFNDDDSFEYVVLDGQQRLTAIHYAFFNPKVKYRRRKNPVYFFLNLEEYRNENYEEAFYYKSKSKYYDELIENRKLQYETNTFPLGMMKEGSWGIEDWLKGYKNFWETKKKEYLQEYDLEKLSKEKFDKLIEQTEINIDYASELRNIFEDLLDNYQISYIELSRGIDIAKVCDIFTNINSKGVKLDTFDLLNAITRPQDIFLKEMYRKASTDIDDNDYPGFEIKNQILMVMSMIAQNYCSPKYLYYLVPNVIRKIKEKDGKIKEIVLIDNKETFEENWNIAVNAIKEGLKILRNPRDFGAINKNFLPYPSIIPVFSTIKAYIRNNDHPNKLSVNHKLKEWYWASIFLNRYSSSVETTSAKDFIDFKKWFNGEIEDFECISELYREYKHIDLHREIRSGSAIYKAIFNIFILNEARDWSTFELPEYNLLDDHHIVPKSWGKDNGLSTEINSILNRTPLLPDTNRRVINSTLPNEYMKRLIDDNGEQMYSIFESHLLSRAAIKILLRKPFSKEDFEEFVNERRKSIVNYIECEILTKKEE